MPEPLAHQDNALILGDERGAVEMAEIMNLLVEIAACAGQTTLKCALFMPPTCRRMNDDEVQPTATTAGRDPGATGVKCDEAP
jgi:hypothetical protein